MPLVQPGVAIAGLPARDAGQKGGAQVFAVGRLLFLCQIEAEGSGHAAVAGEAAINAAGEVFEQPGHGGFPIECHQPKGSRADAS